MTVLLTDGTVGKVEGEAEVGVLVVVTLPDENGTPDRSGRNSGGNFGVIGRDRS